MHPIPGHVYTMRGKNRFRDFSSARVFASEKTRIWKRPLCIYILRTFSLAKTLQKSRTWKSGLNIWAIWTFASTYFVLMTVWLALSGIPEAAI